MSKKLASIYRLLLTRYFGMHAEATLKPRLTRSEDRLVGLAVRIIPWRID